MSDMMTFCLNYKILDELFKKLKSTNDSLQTYFIYTNQLLVLVCNSSIFIFQLPQNFQKRLK